MTIESSLYTALNSLAAGGAWPDVNTSARPQTLPYIVYQQVGGNPINFLDSATLPNKTRPRIQISVWGSTRLAVAALALQVENTLRALTTLQPTVETEQVSVYEDDTKLFGSRQDFSFIA